MIASFQYAGRFERLFANIIDTVIMVVPNAVLMTIGGPGSLLATLGTLLCTLVYFTAFTASDWQATPGKRMLGIYVRRVDGRRLTQRDALERVLAYMLPTLPLYTSLLPEGSAGALTLWCVIVWYAPVLIRDDRAAVHDLLCGTRVVVGKV